MRYAMTSIYSIVERTHGHHSGEENIKTEIYEKFVSEKFCLILHLAVHTEIQNFQYEICGKLLVSLEVSDRSFIRTKYYQYIVCEKLYRFKRNLKSHILTDLAKHSF